MSRNSQSDEEDAPMVADFDDDDEEAFLQAIGDFKPGAITKICLKHFMTHTHLVFEAGPRLNMVIGANGTGKSSILNAICLGLGGDPKLLGRADDLRAFIQHGQQLATVEIHLQPFPDQQPHVFKRVLDANKGSQSKNSRGRGSSTFYINGEKKSVQQVREIVQDQYHIAIENLCTFLPQDKVGDFSGFSDQERLLETEKTLAGGDYHKIHQELIEAEQEVLNSKGNVDTVRDRLEKLQHEKDTLQREKDRMEERKRAEEKADLYRKKKAWLQLEDVRVQALEAKKLKGELKKQVQAAKATIQPLQDRAHNAASAVKEYTAVLKDLGAKIKLHEKEMEKQVTKYTDHDDAIETVSLELASFGSRRAQLQQQYDTAAAKLAEMKESMASMPTSEEIDREFDEAKKALQSSRQAYDQVRRQDRNLTSQMRDLEEKAKEQQGRLTSMNDGSARRKERILRENPNLRKVSAYLDQNRNEFRRPVWGPISCEVTTKSKNSSAFLEFHVPNRILNAYVVETAEDYDKLTDVAKRDLKVPVAVVMVEHGRLKPLTRLYTEQRMATLKQEHGIIAYLDESFDAPDPVLQALRTWAAVHKVLVGSEGTQKSIDEDALFRYLSSPDPHAADPERLHSHVVFSSENDSSNRYIHSRSKYCSDFNLKVDSVRPPRILAPGTNPRFIEQAQEKLAKIHEEINSLRPEVASVRERAQQLENDTQEDKVKFQHFQKKKENLKKFEGKLKRYEQHESDARKALDKDERPEQKKYLRELMNRMSNAIKALEVHRKTHREQMKDTIAASAATLGKNRSMAIERHARDAYEDAAKNFEELGRQARAAEQSYTELRQQLQALKQNAIRVARLDDDEGNPLPLRAQLEELDVTTLAEAQAALEDAEQIVKNIRANNGVFEQYEELERQCKEVEAQLAHLTSGKENQLELIKEKKDPWEAALTQFVNKIDKKFTMYMEEMGCTGQVVLKKGEVDEESQQSSEVLGNFKDWGIQILVSYREGAKAQVLSAQRHSGGERSVATILYLMALQDLMVAPFRCVDEINQGLDERNERLVFKRIVSNSTTPPKNNPTDHSGQYFLITPKLLPNLTDMENEGVKTQLVLNGAYAFDNPTDWNVDNLVRGMLKRTRAGDGESARTSENSQNSVPGRGRKSRKSSD